MSKEPKGVESGSDAVNGSNTSGFEVGNDQITETLVDPLSGQAQDLVAKRDEDKQEGSVTVETRTGILASDGDHGVEKSNGFTDLEKQTESVNGKLDLGTGTQNVGLETKESEKKKKVFVDSEEVLVVKSGKDSDEIEAELVFDKEGTKAENLDVESFVCIEPHESKGESSSSDDDDDNAPVTPKVKLSDSDLVWAKVRSHPWWPGQMFDVSAASDKAKKYSKKGSVLVTYFGDCTFAWNDASKIKPFRQHFPQMAKQSRLPDFVDAIDFALEEVSRRIEFGLACSCISQEVYQKIKTQNIINPGIREDSSSIHGGDKVSSAVFFEPANLVGYVKRLACSPSYGASDELQFVTQRAKLLAFNRWKGYTDLPEFVTLQGSVESAPKISPAEEKSSLLEMKVSEPKKTAQVYTKRKKTEDQVDCKDEKVFEYEDTTGPKKKKEKKEKNEEKTFEYENTTTIPEKKEKEKTFENEDTTVQKKRKKKKEKTLENEDTTVPKKKEKKKTFEYEDTTVPKKKKEKTLADFIAEVRLSKSNEKISHESSAIKADGEKKRKVVHSKPPKPSKKIKANLQKEEDPGSPVSPRNDRKHNLSAADKISPKKARASFGIGASIMKVANQMNCSTPTGLVACIESTSKMAAKNENNGSEKSLQEKPTPKATKSPDGKANSINIDNLQPEEVDQVIKETPSTDLVKDSMLESRDFKEDSSKEQILDEDMKDAANNEGEITVKDSNLTEEKITGSDLKEQPGNKNRSDGIDSPCKEDLSAE